MFLNPNIDILRSVSHGEKSMKSTHQQIFAALLLTISILAMTPNLLHADQQSEPETIAIATTGQATAIGSGPSGATTLNLTAFAYKNSNQWLIIQNTTGSLEIASTTFKVTGGRGSVSAVGVIAIFADTVSGKGQLILQGTMTGNSVTFQTPSQLASTAYLALSGTLTPMAKQAASVVTTSVSSAQDITSVAASHTNATQQLNFTSSSSTQMLQNTTTEAVNTSLAISANVQASNTTVNSITPNTPVGNGTTPSLSSGVAQHSVTIHVVLGQGEICLSSRYLIPVCATASQTVAVRDGDMVNFDADANSGFAWDHYDGLGTGQAQNFDANITQDGVIGAYFMPILAGSSNVTAAITLPAQGVTTSSTSVNSSTTAIVDPATIPVPGNVTVTVTQYVSQTVFVTQTVANETITYTATSATGNTTVTQANMTISVNATTTASSTTHP
jgi:hypothetical protein